MPMTVTTYNGSNISSKLNTASPNNTVNVVDQIAVGGTTNVGVAIVPKGTGAFSLSVPDGTAAGGNVRGANAIDLQTSRSAATQVASGYASFVAGGEFNTASGPYSFASGLSNTVSGWYSTASGGYNTVSGWFTTASGRGVLAELSCASYMNDGIFAGFGDRQKYETMMRAKTTNATPTRMFVQVEGIYDKYVYIPSGKVVQFFVRISGIKSDGTSVSSYVRKFTIKNVGGTTSLVGTVETIGTDIEDNAATDVAITADNTNDALDISVTGIAAETWRWVAVVEGLEIAYGT